MLRSKPGLPPSLRVVRPHPQANAPSHGMAYSTSWSSSLILALFFFSLSKHFFRDENGTIEGHIKCNASVLRLCGVFSSPLHFFLVCSWPNYILVLVLVHSSPRLLTLSPLWPFPLPLSVVVFSHLLSPLIIIMISQYLLLLVSRISSFGNNCPANTAFNPTSFLQALAVVGPEPWGLGLQQ